MPCWRFQALYKIREPFTIYPYSNRGRQRVIRIAIILHRPVLEAFVTRWIWSEFRIIDVFVQNLPWCRERVSVISLYDNEWRMTWELAKTARWQEHYWYVCASWNRVIIPMIALIHRRTLFSIYAAVDTWLAYILVYRPKVEAIK